MYTDLNAVPCVLLCVFSVWNLCYLVLTCLIIGHWDRSAPGLGEWHDPTASHNYSRLTSEPNRSDLTREKECDWSRLTQQYIPSNQFISFLHPSFGCRSVPVFWSIQLRDMRKKKKASVHRKKASLCSPSTHMLARVSQNSQFPTDWSGEGIQLVTLQWTEWETLYLSS